MVLLVLQAPATIIIPAKIKHLLKWDKEEI